MHNSFNVCTPVKLLACFFAMMLLSGLAMAQGAPADTTPIVKKDSVPPEVKPIVDSAYILKVKENTLKIEAVLRETIEKIDRLKDKATAEERAQRKKLADLAGQMKLYSDSLQQIVHQFSLKRDSVVQLTDSIVKVKQAAKDSVAKYANEVKGQIDSVKMYQDKAVQLRAEMAQIEDSLEVIAKITLQKKPVVHLDHEALITAITKAKTEKEKVALMEVVGPNGFRIYTQSQIIELAKNGKYDTIAPFKKEIRVLEVNIDVNEGVIREVIVKTNYGIYRNTKAPIDLVAIGRRLDDRLPRDGEAKYKHEYMKLGEVIEYIPKRSYNDIPYTQFHILLTPDTVKHEKESYLIKESTSINSYFDLAIFTDVKGIGGEPNGIAQISANAKFITRTNNIDNTATIFLNYVSFVGGLSKFDNAFKGTTLLSGDSINRKDLLQRATYSVGVKANIVRGILSPLPRRLIQDIQINAGFNFVGSKILKSFVKDTAAPTVLDTSYYNVTHNQIYIEPIISFARYRNFNMAISLPIYLISLKESSGIRNMKNEIWVRPSIELMYYSKRDSNSKIFFRYNHWINVQTKVDAFLQMQLGYSASITDFFKKN